MRMAALSQVCDSHILKDVNLNSTTDPREYIKLLKEMAVPFKDMIYICSWRFGGVNCSEIFTEVVTEEGICYTFNMLNGQELFRSEVIDSDFQSWNHNFSSTSWTQEKGYKTNSITFKKL